MSGAAPRENLVRAAGGLAAARLGVRFLGVAVGFVVARFLGPEGLGRLSMPNLVLVAAPFLTLGLPDALVRELPLAAREPGLDRRLVATSWYMTGLMAAGLVLLALLLNSTLRLWITDPLLLWLSVASGISNTAFKVSYSELIGRRRVRELALLQLLQGGLRAALVLILLAALPPSAQVYALHAGVSLSLAGSLVWAARRGAVCAPRFDGAALRLLWHSGPPLALASLALMMLVVGDRLVMSRVLPLPALGLYEQGVLIRDGLLLLPAVLLTLLIPDYSARQGDPRQRQGLLADVARQTGLLAVGSPVLLMLVLLQLPWLIGFMLPRFVPGLPVLQLAVLGMSPIFLSYILVSLLMSEGRALQVGLVAACCLAGLLLVDSGWSGEAFPALASLQGPGPVVEGLDRALAGSLTALVAFWTFSLWIMLGNARRLALRFGCLAAWLAPSLAMNAALLWGLRQGWVQVWNPWVNLAAVGVAALWLLQYERRTGQLSKLWRARRAVKT